MPDFSISTPTPAALATGPRIGRSVSIDRAARRTAEGYTWQRVGQRRSDALVRLRERAGFGSGTAAG